MNKAWTVVVGLVALCGCGHEESRAYGFSVGIYSGTAVLLSGATPGCSSVVDPSTDACCDDTQPIALSVSLYSDGYYVDDWPASVDAAGRLVWQETYDGTDNGCTIAASSNETLTQSYVYSYAASTTQTCASDTQTVQCAYTGQLGLQ